MQSMHTVKTPPEVPEEQSSGLDLMVKSLTADSLTTMHQDTAEPFTCREHLKKTVPTPHSTCATSKETTLQSTEVPLTGTKTHTTVL